MFFEISRGYFCEEEYMQTLQYIDDDYYGPGLFIGAILSVVCIISFLIIFFVNSHSVSEEFGLYKALENKTLWQEKAEEEKAQEKKDVKPPEDSDKMKIFLIIRTISLSQNKEETLGLLAKLQDFGIKDRYENIFFRNWEKITKLARGEIENLSSEIKFPSFWNYLLLSLLIAWAIVSLSITINFVGESIYEDESLFHAPWHRPGMYALLAIMMPGILPCYFMEGSVRGIVFAVKAIRSRNADDNHEEERNEHAHNHDSTETAADPESHPQPDVSRRERALKSGYVKLP